MPFICFGLKLYKIAYCMNALMMVLEIIVPLICFGLRLKGMQTTMTCHERIAGSSRELMDKQADGRELMLLYI